VKILYLFPLAILAACSQNPDGTTAFGTKGSPAWFMTATPEAIRNHYQTSCQGYGYMQGTADMTHCIERSATGERIAARQGMAEAMSRVGEQQRATAQRYYDRSLTCTSQSYGSYVETNCR
jgi:hypothetical protein